MRWRIEHDYREMKHRLGLDHFEGRARRGWHHHLASSPPPTPSSPSGASTQMPKRCPAPYQVLDQRQNLLSCWTGICHTVLQLVVAWPTSPW
ncbi:hypothetical protein AB0K43_26245 [Kitasatospora sp. NPDC049258]|uniref:hypothetical protein n=1 Tax=Kitasatospora sp. NPDC049258 TaxID=3155394 RepID=UPI00342F398E